MKVKSLLYMLLDWTDLKVKIKHPETRTNTYYNIKNVHPVYHNNENVLCIEIEREVKNNE